MLCVLLSAGMQSDPVEGNGQTLFDWVRAAPGAPWGGRGRRAVRSGGGYGKDAVRRGASSSVRSLRALVPAATRKRTTFEAIGPPRSSISGASSFTYAM